MRSVKAAAYNRVIATYPNPEVQLVSPLREYAEARGFKVVDADYVDYPNGEQARPGEIHATLKSIVAEYPEPLRASFESDIPRQIFQIEAILKQVGRHATVCDLGGGHSLFAPACAAMGMRSILVGRLSDPAASRRKLLAEVRERVHEKHGVEIIERDLIEEGIDFSPGSLDAVTSFGCIEHLHHSPKRVYDSVAKSLSRDGVFFIGAPNCVNLRKRITVPLGRGKWSGMRDWYDMPRFQGHVREPDVDDLLYVIRDMGLRDPKVYGRNWMGFKSGSRAVRIGTKVVDRVLQMRPTLCSDIYVLARK